MSIATTEVSGMKNEVGVLNLICFVAAIAFVGLAVLNAILSGDFLTTDNLFITLVCLVMALMFAINPLLYLKEEGRLPVPFTKKTTPQPPKLAAATTPLLDAKGRAVPPDVSAMVANMRRTQPKDL